MPVRKREPERGDLRAVDAFPEEFGGNVSVRHTPRKPERIEPGQLEDLRHLRMMSKGIEQPADLHFHAQLLPAIAFGVKDLSHERLPARQIIIGHDVHAADKLQPSRGDKFAERLRFLGISLEERPEVGYLIQSEFIVGMVL